MSFHESIYRRTIETFIRDVDGERFTTNSIPYLTQCMRDEIEQCFELGLIDEEFRHEMLCKLDAIGIFNL